MKKELRKPGQYWIQYEPGEWEVAHYIGEKKWYLQGLEQMIKESELHKIHEVQLIFPLQE